jgi:hypothetical protein
MYLPPSALATVKHIKQAQDRIDISNAAPNTDVDDGGCGDSLGLNCYIFDASGERMETNT